AHLCTLLFPYTTLFRSLADDSRYLREAILGRIAQATYWDRARPLAALASGGSQIGSLGSEAMALGMGGKSFAVTQPPSLGLAFRSEEHTSELQSRENLV